jgi:hypothetical protein
MKINDPKLVRRWNDVMEDIGCEHVTVGTDLSELERNKPYYSIQNGITVQWMREEAEYWLSCYFESGNCRCDDRFIDRDNYAIWRSETGKLKRLIAKLDSLFDGFRVVEW